MATSTGSSSNMRHTVSSVNVSDSQILEIEYSSSAAVSLLDWLK